MGNDVRRDGRAAGWPGATRMGWTAVLPLMFALSIAGAILPAPAQSQPLTQTVSASPALTLIGPPPELSIGAASTRIPFSLMVGATQVDGLTLAQPLLVEDDTKAEFPLRLCSDGEGKKLGTASQVSAGTQGGEGLAQCDGALKPLPANSIHQLSLLTPDGAASGTYSGTLILAIAGKADGIAINLKLHVSSLERRIFGGVAVFVGVVVAFLVTQGAHSLANRDQILLPFILLRGRLNDLAAQLSRTPVACAGSVQTVKLRIDQRLREISDDVLRAKNILPSRVPNPFGSQPTAQLQAAKDLVISVNAWVAALEQIIVEGMAEVWAEAARDLSNAILQTRAQVQTDTLDRLVADPANPPTSDAITRAVTAAVAAMRPAPALAAAAVPAMPPRPRTFRQMELQLDAVSLAVWAVLLIISMVVGIAAIVLKNGFGTPMDYIICVLWGFGVPLSGAQLAGLSPKGVAATLGISVTQ